MVNSKQNLKDYFLPVYALWALITPTIIVFLSGYIFAGENQPFWEAIDWSRVASIYALFGLIWPLTLVISPAFYISFQKETGYTIFEALSFENYQATRMFYGTLLFFVAWGLPVIHFAFNLFRHKKFIELKSDEEIGWLDYLAGYF